MLCVSVQNGFLMFLLTIKLDGFHLLLRIIKKLRREKNQENQPNKKAQLCFNTQDLNFGIAVGVARRSSFYFATPSPLMISAIQINRDCRKLDDYHQDLAILQSLDLDHNKQICFDLSSASVVGFGDPRGPFVLQRDERGFCLLGVPSFILENNGYSKNMGVFAKISFYKEWIMEQLYMQAV